MIKLNRYIVLFAVVPILVLLLTLLMISLIVSTSRRHIYTKIEEIPTTDVALILGAAILRSGNLSPVLKDRVDEAIELYRMGKVEKIIASGDNSTRDYNEVQPVKDYLIENGIPEKDIFLDYAGFDTYSSIYRARDIFLAHSISIVSQSFHLSRAVFIARNLGLTAYGMSADRGHYKLVNYFREMLANIKAIANLLSHRRPKYLGEEIPLYSDEYSPIQTEGKRIIPLW